MTSISKIHFNSTTGVSLNDRFTVISRVLPSEKSKIPRIGVDGGAGIIANGGILRKRSNSVDSINPRGPLNPRGSLVNRQLLHQLDRRHLGGQHSAGLRLRNGNIRSGRQKLNRNNVPSQMQLRRAVGNTLRLVGGSQRLQRSNSLSDVATMNADYFERQAMRRTNSQANITSRLGTSGGRGRSTQRSMQRTNSNGNVARSRSRARSPSNNRSRQRVSRSRSRGGNQIRARSRSGGRNNYGNGVSHSDHRYGRGRSRGRSSSRRGGTYYNGFSRSNSRSNLNRSGSVNGRFGPNRYGRPIANGTRGGYGWKPRRGMRRGAPSGLNGFGGRTGRTLMRGGRGGGGRYIPGYAAGGAAAGTGPTSYRGRSRSRGRAVSQGRARSAQRGRSLSQGRRFSAPSKSKEELDNELDQYMATTKSSLDKEMDEYMNGMNHTA